MYISDSLAVEVMAKLPSGAKIWLDVKTEFFKFKMQLEERAIKSPEAKADSPILWFPKNALYRKSIRACGKDASEVVLFLKKEKFQELV